MMFVLAAETVCTTNIVFFLSDFGDQDAHEEDMKENSDVRGVRRVDLLSFALQSNNSCAQLHKER
eukprot:scaffold494912_cov18-Prasinocladus_malaysianus.AAC.1